MIDTNFPHKPSRVKGTFELVVYANYIVILQEDEKNVMVQNVAYARQQWPWGTQSEALNATDTANGLRTASRGLLKGRLCWGYAM